MPDSIPVRQPQFATLLILALLLIGSPISPVFAQVMEPEQVAFKQTQDAKGNDVTLVLHVFKPAGWSADDQRPAIVFFYGGGWNGGTPTQFYPHCQELASHGMVAVSAEYRVRSRHGTPPQACVADGKSAVRYLRQHAADFGIDPEMLAAGGGSAGGHVAATTALARGFEDPAEDASISSVPNLLVLFNPVIDTTPGRGWGADRLGDDAAALSPVEGVHEDQPPSILFHGTADTTVPVSAARLFKAESDRVGATCVLHEYEGAGHGFFNMKNKQQPDAPANADYHATVAQMLVFLAEYDYVTLPDDGG